MMIELPALAPYVAKGLPELHLFPTSTSLSDYKKFFTGTFSGDVTIPDNVDEFAQLLLKVNIASTNLP